MLRKFDIRSRQSLKTLDIQVTMVVTITKRMLACDIYDKIELAWTSTTILGRMANGVCGFPQEPCYQDEVAQQRVNSNISIWPRSHGVNALAFP